MTDAQWWEVLRTSGPYGLMAMMVIWLILRGTLALGREVREREERITELQARVAEVTRERDAWQQTALRGTDLLESFRQAVLDGQRSGR